MSFDPNEERALFATSGAAWLSLTECATQSSPLSALLQDSRTLGLEILSDLEIDYYLREFLPHDQSEHHLPSKIAAKNKKIAIEVYSKTMIIFHRKINLLLNPSPKQQQCLKTLYPLGSTIFSLNRENISGRNPREKGISSLKYVALPSSIQINQQNPWIIQRLSHCQNISSGQSFRRRRDLFYSYSGDSRG